MSRVAASEDPGFRRGPVGQRAVSSVQLGDGGDSKDSARASRRPLIGCISRSEYKALPGSYPGGATIKEN